MSLAGLSTRIERAEHLYFRGFGYHPVNMERLLLPFRTGRQLHDTLPCPRYETGLTSEECDDVNHRYMHLNVRTPLDQDILLFLRSEARFSRQD